MLPQYHTLIGTTPDSQDRGMIMDAVQNDGIELWLADDKFLQDREIVLAAVRQNGNALRFAGNYRVDREVVLTAIDNNPEALRFASCLRYDREIVLRAVTKDGSILRFASTNLLKDKMIALAAVKSYPKALRHLKHNAPDMCDDKDIVVAAVSVDGAMIKYASPRLAAIAKAGIRHKI